MSTEFIKKLRIELNKNESLEDKELKLIRVQFFKKSNLLKIMVRAKESINKEEEDFIKNTVLKELGLNVDVEILCYKDVYNISTEEIINKYWIDITQDIVRKNPLAKEVLNSKHKNIVNNKVTIGYGSEALIKHLKTKKIEEKISEKIEDIFNTRIKIELSFESSLEESNYEEIKLIENRKMIKDAFRWKGSFNGG